MEKSVTIVDVRTPGEFAAGNIQGSINIPLNEIPSRMSEFKKMAQPLILCCASGARSANATAYLNQNGIRCENGGGWLVLQYSLQNQNLS
ncbi:MAG: rhodanese-like domain-containing protein [Ferruginibacter sp.]